METKSKIVFSDCPSATKPEMCEDGMLIPKAPIKMQEDVSGNLRHFI